LINRFRIEGVSGDAGVARTCCTFFAPASCVKIVGHLIALDRSIWNRAFHADSSG
jgi:beta-lactamase class D